jgi:hypothetical protein
LKNSRFGGFLQEIRQICETCETTNRVVEQVQYADNSTFSTELEIVSLKEEQRQLLSRIDEEEQYLYPREEVNFYVLHHHIDKAATDLIKKLGNKIELPINVRKIAVLCGFERIELDDGRMSKKHAAVVGNVIYVNKNEPDEEQYFYPPHSA